MSSLISRMRANNRKAFLLAVVNVLLWGGFIAALMLLKR